MDLKSLFGTLLTLLGTAGLIYAGISYVNGTGGTKSLLVFGILGFIFFIAGIGLVKRTRDEDE